VRQALGEAGIAPADQPAILVMCGFTQHDVEAIAEHALIPVVWTPEQVGWLEGSGLAVHVEIDTGMARQGVHPGQELEDLLGELTAAGLALDGIFTHFCAAEVAHSDLTQTQERRFEAAIAQVRTHGLAPKWVHAGSSSSVDNPAQPSPWLVDLANSVHARAMVRCGIALYGYCSPITGADAASMPSKLRPALRPIMTWKTRVLSLRDLAAGETVSYNATFTAPTPMRLAMLPVGYSDGLRRELSGSDARPGGWVILRSGDEAAQQTEQHPVKAESHATSAEQQTERQAARRAPIVGRVTMNLTMVDVTAIPGVRIGDEVIVLGDGITADDHARLAATIPYEILCAVRAG
jgi:alanine racemase